jgi:TonB family protein
LKGLRTAHFALLAVSVLATQSASSYPSQSSQDPSVHVASDTKVEKRAKVYHVGGDVKAPRKISGPEPVPGDTAVRNTGKKKVDPGTTVLSVVVDEDGSVRTVKVLKSLNRVLDGKAIDAVKQWRFDPATKNGTPVAVEMAVEVTFHLYK